MNRDEFLRELEIRRNVLSSLADAVAKAGRHEDHTFVCGAVRACNEVITVVRRNDGLPMSARRELQMTILMFSENANTGATHNFASGLEWTLLGLIDYYDEVVEDEG